MKQARILFLSFVIILFIVACHKKAIPEITSRTNFPEAPRSAQLPFDTTIESISAGKIVFETKCSSCHELKDTKIYTTDRWVSILKVMIPRAKLNEEQARQVVSYVIANAKE